MEKISDRWAKLILWASAYINAILFALVGGYYWLKTDREELKSECKKVLWVTLIFLAITMTLTVISSFGTICNGGYRVISVISAVVAIVKVCTYVTLALFSFFGIKFDISGWKEAKAEVKNENKEEKVEVEIVEPETNSDKE